PGSVDRLRGAAEEALGEAARARVEGCAQQYCFLGGHGHALPVDRIEAADGIADGEVAFGKAVEFLVTMARACGIADFIRRGERLRILDDVVDVGRRQLTRVFEEAAEAGGRASAA